MTTHSKIRRAKAKRAATVREAFMKRIRGNPEFQEAKKSGRAFVIPVGK
jgi:hypothetical protein